MAGFSKIKIIISIGVIFGGVLFFANSIFAATYYISASGGNDTRTKAQAQNSSTPWLTIQHCANNAVAGDTCLVAAGTYNEIVSTVNDGTGVNNMITFHATGAAYVQQFIISRDWTKVDGFKFDPVVTSTPVFNEPGAYITVGASNCIISNNVIHDKVYWALPGYSCTPANCQYNPCNAECSTPIGIYNTAGSNNLITLNEISNSRGYGINAGGGGGNIVISYNTIHDIYDDVFRINDHTGPVSILYNHVYNAFDDPGHHADFIQVFTNQGGHDVLIEGNYFHDSTASMGMIWGWDPGAQYNPYNWTWRNNIFRNINGPYGEYVITNLKFFNNVFDNVGGGQSCAFSACMPSEGCTPAAEIKNNFFVNHGTGAGTDCGIGYGAPCGVLNASNNYYAQGSSAGWAAILNLSEPNAINGGNPQFVDYANGDFHLQSSSPAKDKGVAISGWSNPTDKDGVSRPQGSAWDIGAYEYVGSPPDTTPPAAPAGLVIK